MKRRYDPHPHYQPKKDGMTKSSITKLLRSGNFTIIYWDRGEATLYKGKWDINNEYERDDYETMEKSEVDYFIGEDGYCPDIVTLLVHALGGKSDSI
jgi:hypothetical protein